MRAGLGLLLVWAVGCGEGVHSVDHLGQPIVVLKGIIQGELPPSLQVDGLRAAMKWEILPDESLTCLQTAEDNAAVSRCLTAVGLEAIQVTASVPLEPVFPARFSIPLYKLPAPEVLTGPPGALFGYGVLLAYEDGNANGELDLVDLEATASADTVIASGFPTELMRASVFVYREGELNDLWRIFESLGCEQPGQGFSLLDVEASRAGVTCVVSAPDVAEIPVYFEDSISMRQQICLPPPIASSFPAAEPPAGAEIDCHHHDSLDFVADPDKYCMQVQRYDLVGCESLYGCEDPDWNLLDDPPAWWPCTGESDGGFSLIDAADPLTAGPDELFTIRYDSGQELFAPLDLEVAVYPEQGQGKAFVAPGSIRFLDQDHDSLFGPEDVLEVFEPVGNDWFNPTHDGTTVKVVLRRRSGLTVGETLAELTWRP